MKRRDSKISVTTRENPSSAAVPLRTSSEAILEDVRLNGWPEIKSTGRPKRHIITMTTNTRFANGVPLSLSSIVLM